MDPDTTIWQVLVNKVQEAGVEQTAGASMLLHCEHGRTYLLKYKHSLGNA